MRDTSTLTILFSDIEGSTAKWEISPAMLERVEQHYAILRAAVSTHRGEEFSTSGDGLAASFSSVAATVGAAIQIQRDMAATGLSVRIGVHTGEVQRAGGELLGRTLNRAARMTSVGHGGQILVSDISATLLRSSSSSVRMVDLGSHRLRDLADPERIWQVVDPELRSAFPPLRGLDTFTNNLPSRRSSFVGRDAELREIVELITRRRIVTLTGPGGVGKTRLSVQAAADALSRFDAVWFVEADSTIDDPAHRDRAVDELARAIAVVARVDPEHDALRALTKAFRSRPVLVVLDNCEQVVVAAAQLAERLTDACPELHLLVSSRESLGIEGERVVRVRPLDPLLGAVELFAQRATEAGATIDDASRPTIARICETLDGLPLAIELAAARAPAFGLDELLGALDDRFDVLAGGRRRAPDRHRALRATVDWSYRLLDAQERRLFEWLAAFRGGFELDGVVAIGRPLAVTSAETQRQVASLVSKSLLEVDQSRPVARYRMLETVRVFAEEMLDLHGESMAAAKAQAEWMCQVTDLSYDDPCNAAVEAAAIRLEREADNWRQAMLTAAELADPELGRRLCGPATSFFLLGRHDMRDVVAPLLDVCLDPVARRAVASAMAVAATGSTDVAEIRRWSDEVTRCFGEQSKGAAELVTWVALTSAGQFEASVDVCLRAADDVGFTQDTRDLFVGIAVTDRFSLTDSEDRRAELADRAAEVAGRSTTRLQRVTCLLGAAWALLPDEPRRSLDFVRRATEDIPLLPAFLQRTLPGNVSRLLAIVDPRLAASEIIARLEAHDDSGPTMDFLPVVHGAVLLHRVGHPAAGPALATLAASTMAPYLLMMGLDTLAGEAARVHRTVSLEELVTSVHRGLSSDEYDLWNRGDTG